MADIIFNIAKGAIVEKIRDGSSNLLVLILEAVETETDLMDHDNLSSLLGAAGNTEATATGYSRKTGITGVVTVDHTSNEASVAIPDQQWDAISGGNPFVAAVVAYEESASDTGRIPLSKHDISYTPQGVDFLVRFP